MYSKPNAASAAASREECQKPLGIMCFLGLDRNVFGRLHREVGDCLFEPLGHVPVGVTKEVHESGHQDGAKDERVHQNGATETELIEAITHLAFYAGWPKAMSAMAIAKQVFATND